MSIISYLPDSRCFTDLTRNPLTTQIENYYSHISNEKTKVWGALKIFPVVCDGVRLRARAVNLSLSSLHWGWQLL